jgi:WD40 repeat protein
MSPRCFIVRGVRLTAGLLLVVLLVGWGLALHQEVSPGLRCTIYTEGPFGGLSADGARLVTFGKSSQGVHVWDTHSGRELGSFPEIEPLNGTFSASGRFLPEVKNQDELSLIDTRTGRLLKIPLKGLDPPQVSSRRADGSAQIYTHESRFTFSPNEDILAVFICSGPPQHAVIPLVETMEAMMCVPLGMAQVVSAYTLPRDGGGSSRFSCRFIDLPTLHLLDTIEGARNYSAFWAFDPQGDRFLIGMRDSQGRNGLGIWNVKTRKLQSIQPDIEPLLLSPDGRKLLAHTPEGNTVIDLTTARAQPLALADADWWEFSPDGSILMTMNRWEFISSLGDDKKMAYGFFKTSSGRKLGSVSIPPSDKLEFSPDSRFLLGVGSRNFTRVMTAWKATTLQTMWEKRDFVKLGWWSDRSSHLLIVYPVSEQKSEVQLLDVGTGDVRTTIKVVGSLSIDSDRLLTREGLNPKEPGPLAKLMGRWWPFPEATGFRSRMKVLELPNGRELGSVEMKDIVGTYVAKDGKTLVTPRMDGYDCWSLPIPPPFRRSLWTVIGLPLGLGILLLVLIYLFRRRRSSAG